MYTLNNWDGLLCTELDTWTDRWKADLPCMTMGPPPSWSCAFCSTPIRSMMAAVLIGQWSSRKSKYWYWHIIRLPLI